MSKKITVIGGGPAGYVAAIRASQLGAKVALVESANLGGVCTNVGCIPTKTYYHYAEIAKEINEAQKDKIVSGELSFDWLRILRKKDGIVKRLVAGINFLIKKNEIELNQGTGKIIGRGKVEVLHQNGETGVLSSDEVLIATGSAPRGIPIEGWEGSGVWSNTEALSAEKVPESLLIVGGGVIGCEFAHIFSTFGSKVTIVELTESLLPGIDPDIVDIVTKTLAKQGVSIRTGIGISRIERTAEGIVAIAGDERFEAEEILGAVGRKPTPPEGIELAGGKLVRGDLAIDEHLRAGESLWGAGDVCGAPFLAHWASAMGEVAVENMMGMSKTLDRSAIPGAFFTAIEVGTVGLTEPQARERFGDVMVGMFPYQASGRAKTASAADGFSKVIAEKTGRIVGIHIAGKHSSEMVCAAGLTVARKLAIDDWRDTIVAHPTFGEILKESALDSVGDAVHI